MPLTSCDLFRALSPTLPYTLPRFSEKLQRVAASPRVACGRACTELTVDFAPPLRIARLFPRARSALSRRRRPWARCRGGCERSGRTWRSGWLVSSRAQRSGVRRNTPEGPLHRGLRLRQRQPPSGAREDIAGETSLRKPSLVLQGFALGLMLSYVNCCFLYGCLLLVFVLGRMYLMITCSTSHLTNPSGVAYMLLAHTLWLFMSYGSRYARRRHKASVTMLRPMRRIDV